MWRHTTQGRDGHRRANFSAQIWKGWRQSASAWSPVLPGSLSRDRGGGRRGEQGAQSSSSFGKSLQSFATSVASPGSSVFWERLYYIFISLFFNDCSWSRSHLNPRPILAPHISVKSSLHKLASDWFWFSSAEKGPMENVEAGQSPPIKASNYWSGDGMHAIHVTLVCCYFCVSGGFVKLAVTIVVTLVAVKYT